MVHQDKPGSAGVRERGFVLVLVLLLGVLLAVFAGAFATTVRIHLRGASSAVEAARAEAAADAAVNLALMDLERARSDQAYKPRLQAGVRASLACRVDAEIVAAIEVEDEAGKVALNTSNERLLKALFVGLGAPSEAADEYVDRLEDYRDPDDEPRKNGAEIEEYTAEAGNGAAPPKNGPFETVDELDQIRGIPKDLIARVKPFVSAHSTLNGIDPDSASEELPLLLQSAAETLLLGTGRAVDITSGNVALPTDFLSRSNRKLFTLRGVGRTMSGATFVREAVVEFAPVTGGAHVLKAWRRGVLTRTLSTLDPEAALPPC